MSDTCTYVAVLNGERFPCHSHEGGLHHFAAAIPDPCNAPFCRLPAGHRTLHDIPSGRAEVVDASEFKCDDCGCDLVSGAHKMRCRNRWPKRGLRFTHATETWQPFSGAEFVPTPCEITRVVHQSCVWYRTPSGRRAIPYADFRSILGEWIS